MIISLCQLWGQEHLEDSKNKSLFYRIKGKSNPSSHIIFAHDIGTRLYKTTMRFLLNSSFSDTDKI